jgi:hypothetical protein
MKKTMIATVLGLALMPLTFAAQQTPAKPANQTSSTDTAKPTAKKQHKKTHNKKVNKTQTPAAPAAAPSK